QGAHVRPVHPAAIRAHLRLRLGLRLGGRGGGNRGDGPDGRVELVEVVVRGPVRLRLGHRLGRDGQAGKQGAEVAHVDAPGRRGGARRLGGVVLVGVLRQVLGEPALDELAHVLALHVLRRSVIGACGVHNGAYLRLLVGVAAEPGALRKRGSAALTVWSGCCDPIRTTAATTVLNRPNAPRATAARASGAATTAREPPSHIPNAVKNEAIRRLTTPPPRRSGRRCWSARRRRPGRARPWPCARCGGRCARGLPRSQSRSRQARRSARWSGSSRRSRSACRVWRGRGSSGRGRPIRRTGNGARQPRTGGGR